MRDMDVKRKISVSLVFIISIFIIGFVLGAAIFTGYIEFTRSTSIPEEVSVPGWKSGKYWTYSFKTPEIEDVVSRIVVATDDGTDYLVGVASRIDAQRHAVLNYNPMLGRITLEDLAVYEKGIPQSMFTFPLKKSSKWTFSMFDIENFEAEVKDIRSADLPGGGTTFIVDIQAVSPDGHKLTYSYDTSAQWIRSLVREDSGGNILLEMTLVSCGYGFAGDVYFIRGVDLFKNTYNAPVLDVENSFWDAGHEDWGPFDYLVYYYEVTTDDQSGGTLTVTDPLEQEAMKRYFGPNTFERALGTIPSGSGEYKVTTALAGQSTLELRIAGGLEYKWIV
jgi:hypothetical protein